MPVQTVVGAELLPGYRLIERIGAGGYGEVWKATAPGGLTKAIKIIFGQVGQARAEQELKALSRIREVRHPFLLSLERFEIVEGQLLIVTELAEGSLLERFVACCEKGMPGIPRDELLAYVRDASDALDFMNEVHGLQHLDIKPENLLLLGGRIKIADFGLVKDFHAARVTITSGVTAVYATPEAFDGKVSRFSDQYSLAIVYQEMLTGIRPFPGTTTFQLAFQHTSCPPNLDPLPTGDRAIIARALAKIPEERFERCAHMASCLLRINISAPTPVVPPADVPVWKEAEDRAETSSDQLEEEAQALALKKILQTDSKIPDETSANVKVRANDSAILSSSIPWSANQARLRPTLFLGLGGIAVWTLRRLRRRLQARFGRPDVAPIFSFLAMDTDREGLRRARRGGVADALAIDETLLTALHRPEHYRTRSKELLRWLDRGWLYGIPSSKRTEGMRPLGRLALIDNLTEVQGRIRAAITKMTSLSALAATQQATGMVLSDAPPRIYLIASASGGNSGMVVDLAFAVRQVLSEMGHSAEGLCGLLAHATSPKPVEQDLARINAYATLRELHHYANQGSVNGGEGAGRSHPPFTDCYFIHLGDGLGEAEAEAATDLLAEYLYLDVATSASKAFASFREPQKEASSRPTVRTFGISRISFPRQAMADRAGDRLCHSLVQRWRGRNENLQPAQAAEEAERLLTDLGLGTEALIDRLNALIPGALGGESEEYLRELLAAFSPADAAQPAWAELTPRILTSIDDTLGEADGNNTTTLFQVSLSDQAKKLGVSLGKALEEWLRAAVENPERRLSVAAHYTRWFLEYLGAATERVGKQRATFRQYREQLRHRLMAGELSGKRSGLRWLGFVRRHSSASGPAGKFLEYWQVRLAEYSLTNGLAILGAVYRQISTFAQELADCQQRLGAFVTYFTPPAEGNSTDQKAKVPNRIEVFPGEANDRASAVDELLRNLDHTFIDQLDANAQRLVLGPYGGLWEVLRAAEMTQPVQKELQRRARSAILHLIKNLDAAKLFLQKNDKPARVRQSMVKLVQASTPAVNVPGIPPKVLVAVPGGSAGDAVEVILQRIVPDVQINIIDSDGDVIVCQEVGSVPIANVAATLIDGNVTHVENARRVLSRNDVEWADLPLPAGS